MMEWGNIRMLRSEMDSRAPSCFREGMETCTRRGSAQRITPGAPAQTVEGLIVRMEADDVDLFASAPWMNAAFR